MDQDAHAPWLAQAPPSPLDVGDGLTLRAWDPTHVDDLTDAVLASLDELKPWMPWANGFDRASAADFVARMGAARVARTEFAYGLFEGDRVLGSTGLHARIGEGRLEIGYWVHVDHWGRGIARRVSATLVAAAFTLPEVEAVEIRHDPANVRSGRVPDALGFRHLGVLRIGSTDESVDRDDSSVWELTRAAYESGAGRLPA